MIIQQGVQTLNKASLNWTAVLPFLEQIYEKSVLPNISARDE
jgi:hypothetical protein